jgi:hypothetical protein
LISPQERNSSINRRGELAVFNNMKLALAAAFVLGAASAAVANDVETDPGDGATTCPALEGYPDCHPEDRAAWTADSTHSRRPVVEPSRHQRRP